MQGHPFILHLDSGDKIILGENFIFFFNESSISVDSLSDSLKSFTRKHD